jgi:D-glycero-alpha-D-manno-heptose-7-phosphate kinase
VGLLNALYAYQGKHKSAEELAKDACYLEIDVLGEPIGKQDQYIAAYGGLQHIRFNPDESVFVDPVICSKKTLKELQDNLLLFYTGITRNATSVLTEQKENIDKKTDYLNKLRGLAVEAASA